MMKTMRSKKSYNRKNSQTKTKTKAKAHNKSQSRRKNSVKRRHQQRQRQKGGCNTCYGGFSNSGEFPNTLGGKFVSGGSRRKSAKSDSCGCKSSLKLPDFLRLKFD